MKEQLHTIPITEAMENAGECPFCYIERKTEEHALDFVLGHGASYMEADIRDMTDKAGFCRPHYKKMFDYGNALGNAWILKTYYYNLELQLDKEFQKFKPASSKKGLFSVKNQNSSANSLANWIDNKEQSCFICESVNKTFRDYMDTFFRIYKKEPDFRDKIKNSKGFCLSHFKLLCLDADAKLNQTELAEFYEFVLPLMKSNIHRIYEDVAWFIEKYDYRNKDADWKNSKDAIQRAMQKAKGSDPSIPTYQLKK